VRVEAIDLIDNAHSRADGVVGVIVPLGLDIARLTNCLAADYGPSPESRTFLKVLRV